jgi:V/A-type H+-transporting ATPase subunit E
MQNKLQELTDKIYNEGVSKANKDADQILKNANNKSAEIIAEAKKKADKILKDAENGANDLKSKTESEIRQASLQTIKSVQQSIAAMISSEIVDKEVKTAFTDKTFVKTLIETAVKNWSTENPGMDLHVLIPEKDQKNLEDFFKKNAKKLCKAGLDVITDTSIKAGFKIGPADGAYQISFKEEDFENLLKNFIRPRTAQLLFKK